MDTTAESVRTHDPELLDMEFWTGPWALEPRRPRPAVHGDAAAIAAERERLAVDLHDTVGQAFVAIGLLADVLAEDVADRPGAALRARRIAELADRGLSGLDDALAASTFACDVEPGLVPALHALLADLADDSGIEIAIALGAPLDRLGDAEERALFRIAREAVTNAWRHARCRSVRVEIDCVAEEVVLRVADDGIGATGSPGTGILGMRRAAASAGGAVTLRSNRPRGTLVEARIPRTGR